MILRTKELVRLLKARSNNVYNIGEFEDFLQLFRAEVEEQIKLGNTIQITDFGSFVPKRGNDKVLYSGLLKKEIQVKGGTTMKFTVSPKMQTRIRINSLTEGFEP